MTFSDIGISLKKSLNPENVVRCSRPYVRIANGAFAGSFFGMVYGIVFGGLYALVGSVVFTMGFDGLSSFSEFWLQSQRVVVLAMMLGALLCGIFGGINALRKTS